MSAEHNPFQPDDSWRGSRRAFLGSIGGVAAATVLGGGAFHYGREYWPESEPWYASIKRYEKGFTKVSPEKKREILGEIKYKDILYDRGDSAPEQGGLFTISFVLPQAETAFLYFEALPDPNVSAPVVEAQFRSEEHNLDYQVPILRTPHFFDQRIPLRFARAGENTLTITPTPASADITPDNLIVVPQVLEDPNPVVRSLMNCLPIVGMRSESFAQLASQYASDQQKLEAQTNDAPLSYEVNVLESDTEDQMLLIEIFGIDRSETTGSTPQELKKKTATHRMYDKDQNLFIKMDKAGYIHEMAYQHDFYENFFIHKSHQVEILQTFDPPVESTDERIVQALLLHGVGGHGMLEPELETVEIEEGREWVLTEIDKVTSFAPRVMSTDEVKSDEAAERELGKKLIAVRANLQKVDDYFNQSWAPGTFYDSNMLKEMSDRRSFLLEELANLEDQLAEIAA